MNSTEMIIREGRDSDHDALVEIWLDSVRASHQFLTEAKIQELLPIVRESALKHLELWLLTNGGNEIIGFLGLSGASVEALFLSPKHFRCGGGKLLIEHARRLKGKLKVDVNEQNPEATKFYLACGFRIVGRSEVDSDGRPYPLLHLSE